MELTGTISIRMAMKWLTTMWTTTMKNVIADIKDFLHIPKTILQKMPLILKNNPEDKTKVETMTIMLTPLVTTMMTMMTMTMTMMMMTMTMKILRIIMAVLTMMVVTTMTTITTMMTTITTMTN